MFNIDESLAEYGLTRETYEQLLKDCSDKVDRNSDLDWSEIADKYGIDWNGDSLRKGFTPKFIGGAFVKQYLEEKYANGKTFDEDSYMKELDIKLANIRKERMKLQTVNLERNRLDRCEAKQELYYEQIANAITTLPLPEFEPINYESNGVEYLVTIADIHYGAAYESTNNKYSPEICKERFEYLAGYIEDFCKKHEVSKLHIIELGDSIQGILRLSDLKINDSSIVKATVEVSRLIANFLRALSRFVEVEYYHVPSANHSQLRPLGSKASQLADEDLEFVISNYIKDSLSDNKRVHVNLAPEGSQYLDLNINGFDIISGHGHTVKNLDRSLNDLNALRGSYADYVILGHFHGGLSKTLNEGCTHDCELIVAPSFIGSDPYSDSLMIGAKGACQILGFDEIYGHTETYKIILN